MSDVSVYIVRNGERIRLCTSTTRLLFPPLMQIGFAEEHTKDNQMLPSVSKANVAFSKTCEAPPIITMANLRKMTKLSHIAGNKMRSFVQSYEMTDGKWRLTSPFPLELKDTVAFCPSPSGKLLAIIREDSAGDGKDPKNKNPGYVIEVWGNEEQGGSLLDQIPTAGSHGKLIGDTWFGGLGWAPDESKLVYVAQKNAVETRYVRS